MLIPHMFNDAQVLKPGKNKTFKVVAVFSDVVEMVATNISEIRCMNGSYLLIYADGDTTEIPSGKALYITFSTESIESE